MIFEALMILSGVAETEGLAAGGWGGFGTALEGLAAAFVEEDDCIHPSLAGGACESASLVEHFGAQGIEIIGAEEVGEEVWDSGGHGGIWLGFRRGKDRQECLGHAGRR